MDYLTHSSQTLSLKCLQQSVECSTCTNTHAACAVRESIDHSEETARTGQSRRRTRSRKWVATGSRLASYPGGAPGASIKQHLLNLLKLLEHGMLQDFFGARPLLGLLAQHGLHQGTLKMIWIKNFSSRKNHRYSLINNWIVSLYLK